MCMEFGVSKEKKSIIKGKHTYEELLTKLDTFIAKYLLCPKCELPEISLFSDKDILKGKCRACGNVGKLDNSHKLTGYIIKNIPKDMSEITAGDTVDVSESISKKEKKSKKKDKEDEKEEEEVEVEEEVVTHESEHIIQAIENIQEYIKEKGETLKMSELKDEIHNQCISARATQDLKHFIVFNSFFTINILKEFPKFKDLLKSIVAADKKDGAKSFIMVMVKFFIEKYPKLEIAIPTFLHHVYEAEIISESVFLKWESKKFKTNKKSCLYNKKHESVFKKKAEKFLTWLKEAEEDDDEGEEDEEEKKENENLTEEQIKEKKMKELIEKEKEKQEKELAEIKQKQAEEKKIVQEEAKASGKIDISSGNDDEEFNIDDI